MTLIHFKEKFKSSVIIYPSPTWILKLKIIYPVGLISLRNEYMTFETL